MTIQELFEGYDGEYTVQEIDWGEPQGREKVWYADDAELEGLSEYAWEDGQA